MADARLHLGSDDLERGLDFILESPRDNGIVEMIVRRPTVDEREVLEFGDLDIDRGLIGDNWLERCLARDDGQIPKPETQLNIMNSRVIALVATSKDRWDLAGDQIYIDLDLSKENLPAGMRLEIGEAVIEASSIPHTGCRKFVDRFGIEAMKFVNSRQGKKLCLRGINARVVKPGRIRPGDIARKLT
jgi:hypothetical protein